MSNVNMSMCVCIEIPKMHTDLTKSCIEGFSYESLLLLGMCYILCMCVCGHVRYDNYV
jgi:hypothetical protein